MRFMVAPALIIALLASAWTSVASAQVVTLVVRKPGGRIEEEKGVRLTKDTFRKVEARQGRARLTLNPEEVVEIRFERAPSDWSKGYNAFKDNEFNSAIGFLRTAMDSAASNPWMKAYGNYYLGQSYRSVGALDDATQAFQAMIKAAPDHRLIPNAWDALGQMAMLRGQAGADQARDAFSSLQKLVERERLDRSYLVTAKRGLATIEARFGDAAEGRRQLQGLLGEAKGAEANLIRLEIGRSLNRQKKYDEAETFFKTILEKATVGTPDPVVIAGASNGLGDSQYFRNRYDDARFTYSRVYGTFFDRDDLKTYVAHALFYGGKAFELAATKVAGADEKKLLKRRGRLLIKRAADERFRATPGGVEARRDLGF